jgi:hypothetical protein
MFLGPDARTVLCSSRYIPQLCFSFSPRNISYVPRPSTYVPQFLAEEHLSIYCSVCSNHSMEPHHGHLTS